MTKLEHLKQNWVTALIWNSQLAFAAFIIIRSITSNVWPNIIVPIVVVIVFMGRDLDKWYMEKRMDEMQKEIDELKTK